MEWVTFAPSGSAGVDGCCAAGGFGVVFCCAAGGADAVDDAADANGCPVASVTHDAGGLCGDCLGLVFLAAAVLPAPCVALL